MPSEGRVFNSLGVVIPAYNAAAVIAQTLEDVYRWIDAQGPEYVVHVVVVDDGSIDHTSEIVRRFARPVALLHNETNRGKGYSVRRGILAAIEAMPKDAEENGWVLFMDADNSTPITHLDRFSRVYESQIEPKPEILIGSRRTVGSHIVERQQAIRQILGKTFPYVVRLLALHGIADTQCGFKLFRVRAARRIFSFARIERFAFDVEALMLARRVGYRILEIGVDWENPTNSTLRIARDAPKMLWDVFKACWRLREGGRVVREIRAAE